jgi:hypothetical protein
MPLPSCEVEITTFYSDLQTACDLDLRDNRGKQHDLSVILIGVCLALFCKRDGNLSSIQRHMKNHYSKLCEALNIPPKKVVSRSQLPLVLSKVHLSVFESLVLKYSGFELSQTEKLWFSVDGKELRGSIEPGDKRGHAVVPIVRHSNYETVDQAFYLGKKESEKTCVKELLEHSGLLNQRLSFDALHFNPETLNAIEAQNGVYLVGLKDNQPALLTDMIKVTENQPIVFANISNHKGHGRTESRIYQIFNVSDHCFDSRFAASGLKTLIKIRRKRLNNKTQKESDEIAFYMSNEKPENQKMSNELCGAIRNHWSVEVVNNIRDVILKEDQFRTKKKSAPKPWRV